ncbi:MAG: hypothetical protein EP332_05355 [Bacteroidetes bacterium]|nr:MAG: hypothetical protein EP332_05355 [Bacteroidota bacterium]
MREPKVYRIKKGWKIALPFLLLFVFCIGPLIILQDPWDDPNEKMTWLIAVISIEFILFIWYLKSGLKYEVILSHEGITAPFGMLNKKRFVRWNEIESYELFSRDGVKSIRLTLTSGKSRTLFGYNLYESSASILVEIIRRFKSRHEIEEEVIKETLLEDEELGINQEERIQKVQHYKKICKVLNSVGGIAAALYLFWPKYYEMLFWVCFLTVLIAFCLVIFTKARISPLGVDSEYIPSVFTSVFFIPLVMIVRVLMDLNFLHFPMELFWVLIPSILIAALVASFSSEKGERLLGFGYILLCCLFWFSSSMCSINYFTAENPETKMGYTRSVLDKEINTPTKGPTTYHIYVPQIENSDDPIRLDISQRLYTQLAENDSLIIWVNTGVFGIPVVTEYTPLY